MRAFTLVRDEDVTGISGTGVVAEGIEFTGGIVALRWLSEWPTSVVFHDRGIASVEAVHGHGGKTRIVWHDRATEVTIAGTGTKGDPWRRVPAPSPAGPEADEVQALAGLPWRADVRPYITVSQRSRIRHDLITGGQFSPDDADAFLDTNFRPMFES